MTVTIRELMYVKNVTLLRQTILAMEKQNVLHILSVCF
jgi:hypothetical protein